MNRVKIVAIITSVLFIGAALTGIVFRSSYTDMAQDEDILDKIEITLMSDKLMDSLNLEGIAQIAEEEAQYILRVKADGNLEYKFRQAHQKAQVEEVYRGEGVEAGDEITLLSAWTMFFPELGGESYKVTGGLERVSMNMGFVNRMVSGEEYIVYISEKVTSLDETEQVYQVFQTSIAPIFACRDIENVIPEGNFSYSDIKNNEFLVQTEKALEKMTAMKKRLTENLLNAD